MEKIGGFDLKLYLVISFIFLLMFSLASAGIGEWYAKITGKATDDTTSLSVTIGNNAPTINYVSVISAQDPSESGLKDITFTFNATDTDGAVNLNDSSAQVRFQRGGETTRSNTSCALLGESGNTAEYECTIGMEYYDGSGAWIINATVEDINGDGAENSTTTFTYNLLTSMVMSPTALAWGSLQLTDTNTGATNNPILINNTGNDNSLTVNVTGYDLAGVTTTTEYIYAANFSVDNATAGCAGDVMGNASSLALANALLENGDNSINAGDATSGQEELYFCLKGIPQDISAQDYSSGALAWNVQIIT